ncbi:MAG: winged helix-turn-helix transcriptional regulator [Candidatus Gracilibacteria bacterium]
MKTLTGQKIVEYIEEHSQATAKELSEFLNISPQALFRQLAKLQERGQITKIGTPPKVFYLPVTKGKEAILESTDLTAEERQVIDTQYIHITPLGEKKEGIEGFIYWTEKTHQPFHKTAHEYIQAIKKYDKFKDHGLIDATSKLQNTFEEFFLDKLYYLDFYSIERFGKTKLGQLLLYAKQSQNMRLMKELIAVIEPNLKELIVRCNIDAIGFIPPTVKRETQFMKVLESALQLNIHKLPIIKIKSEIMVPQKTLTKLADRIENAQKTMFVDTKTVYNNVLLIDDAVGSGATLNETAGQIRRRGLCTGKIIGVAITGSLNGFDVISEV